LLEIAETPREVRISGALLAACCRPAQTSCTARWRSSPDAASPSSIGLLAPRALPVAGIHGAERRDASGSLHAASRVAGARAVRRRSLADFVASIPACCSRTRNSALAVHFRRVPELDTPSTRRPLPTHSEGCRRIPTAPGSKMVLEIKPRHASKGEAIARYMLEAPFAGRIPGLRRRRRHLTRQGFDTVNRLGGHSDQGRQRRNRVTRAGDCPTSDAC
jgi:trehalose 6-phosphate phosphatase